MIHQVCRSPAAQPVAGKIEISHGVVALKGCNESLGSSRAKTVQADVKLHQCPHILDGIGNSDRTRKIVTRK
jgi:hypothetical protein